MRSYTRLQSNDYGTYQLNSRNRRDHSSATKEFDYKSSRVLQLQGIQNLANSYIREKTSNSSSVIQLGRKDRMNYSHSKKSLKSHKHNMKFVKTQKKIKTAKPPKSRAQPELIPNAGAHEMPLRMPMGTLARGGGRKVSGSKRIIYILLMLIMLSSNLIQAVEAQHLPPVQHPPGPRRIGPRQGIDSMRFSNSTMAIRPHTETYFGDLPPIGMEVVPPHHHIYFERPPIIKPTKSTRFDEESFRPKVFDKEPIKHHSGDFSEPGRHDKSDIVAKETPARIQANPTIAKFIFGLRRNLHELNAIPRDDLSTMQWLYHAPAWVYLPYLKGSPTEAITLIRHFHMHSLEAYKQISAINQEARDFRSDLFQVDTDKPVSGLVQKNALRHSFWTCRLTREFGPSFAKDISDAHEYAHMDLTIEGPYDHVTDKINNMIGIHLGKFLNRECGDWVQSLWSNGTLAYAAEFRINESGRQTASVHYQQPINFLVQINASLPSFDILEMKTLEKHNIDLSGGKSTKE